MNETKKKGTEKKRERRIKIGEMPSDDKKKEKE